jgi:hypothetical protein
VAGQHVDPVKRTSDAALIAASALLFALVAVLGLGYLAIHLGVWFL